MKPAGLMIAVGAPKPAAKGEDEEAPASSKTSASSALFDERAAKVAKVLGLDASKNAAFSKALKAAIMACDYGDEG